MLKFRTLNPTFPNPKFKSEAMYPETLQPKARNPNLGIAGGAWDWESFWFSSS